MGKNVRDTGISIELIESTSRSWLLDGWSLDAYGSSRRCGLGVAKDIFETDLIQVDAGVYATKRLVDLVKTHVTPDLSFGISVKRSF